MNRRQFLVATSTLGVAAAAGSSCSLQAAELKTATAAKLPRWRGFNLTEKCVKRRNGKNPPFLESDFTWLEEWGFDFARLPLSYQCGTEPEAWLKVQEAELNDIDEAVEFGRKHGVHINLNLHRAPGYCVNPPKEPLNLWTDEKALEACAFHWAMLAKRYKGIPQERVSFDLLNEPTNVNEETYVRVIKHLVQSIRAEDPQRLIIADGLNWGRDPVNGLVELGIAQSTRGYDPMRISHYKANWVRGSDAWAEPTWPLALPDKPVMDKERLRKERIAPWQQLEKKGVGIHVGEWGAFTRTPHKVVLAWMRDCLDLWKDAGWGWALWNLRGGFGVLDTQRPDAEYEDFHGHKLDLEMLKVLQTG